jgi:anti-anti-sigma factor
MEIREFREGDVLVLAPDGSVTGSEETNAIEAKLGTSLKAGFRLLVLDCTVVGQLTSAAIRVLLQTSKKLDRTEGRLVLCAMNPKLTKAFSISGFDKDFTVVGTRQEALVRVLEPAPRRHVRKERPPAPEPAPSVEVSAAPPVAVEPAPAADVPADVGSRTAAVDSIVPEPAAPAHSPGQDRREAAARVLLHALHARITRFETADVSRSAAPSNLDELAGGLLAALRGRA